MKSNYERFKNRAEATSRLTQAKDPFFHISTMPWRDKTMLQDGNKCKRRRL